VIADEKPEPSVGELLKALGRDTGVLVRQELQLASAELTVKGKRFTRQAGLIALGGAVTLIGFAALTTAGIVAMQALMPLWSSALLVGLVVTGAGGALVGKGIGALKRLEALPERTVKTLREDVEWAKEQVR
jgi:hypothetical protein